MLFGVGIAIGIPFGTPGAEIGQTNNNVIARNEAGERFVSAAALAVRLQTVVQLPVSIVCGINVASQVG